MRSEQDIMNLILSVAKSDSRILAAYLCDNTTDVYSAVKALEIGQTIDMEGFLYWYEGVNPHITSVTVAQ